MPDMKEEQFRRKSDSFFHINSNQREIAMMKITQAENQLSFERQVHGEEMRKLKEKIILAREPRGRIKTLPFVRILCFGWDQL